MVSSSLRWILCAVFFNTCIVRAFQLLNRNAVFLPPCKARRYWGDSDSVCRSEPSAAVAKENTNEAVRGNARLTRTRARIKGFTVTEKHQQLMSYSVEHQAPTSRRAFLCTSLLAYPLVACAAETSSVGRQTFQETVSGLVAGAALTITKTLVKYPLDTITVRLQMKNSDYSVNDIRRLFGKSYRGFAAPLLANIPAGAVFFAVKDASKANFRQSGLPPYVQTCIAVALAQIPYWLVRNPSEVVKTRQQANVPGYGDGVSALAAYRRIFYEARNSSKNLALSSKLSAFYVGYWENILYAFPADVIKFLCYDQLTGGRKDLSPAEGAMAGAISTALSQFLTTPLDVLRNRRMAGSTHGGKTTAPSYLESIVQLTREEGLNGLFAGSVPRIGKAILSGAIQFATYEEAKQDVIGWLRIPK